MDSITAWVSIVGLAIVSYLAVRAIEKRIDDQHDKISNIDESLLEIRALLSEMEADVESKQDPWIDVERSSFNKYRPLLAEEVSSIPAGATLHLKMRTYTEQGTPLMFDVEYVHREFAYRSSNQRDPIAYGTAKYEGDSEFKEVRILFSRLDQTASLKGLSLEGYVRK